MIFPVILCGGSGTRLWPVSRRLLPKQFHSLLGENTLLQATVARLKGCESAKPPIVLCNHEHRFIVSEQLKQTGAHATGIYLEPVGRNTAPAAAIAALIAIDIDPQAVIAVLASDHVLMDEDAFITDLTRAHGLAEQEKLVTFGIKPDKPETGYGYIQRGAPIRVNDAQAYDVEKFVEKPDAETAQKYLDSGDYFWNSGMFVFKAQIYLNELNKFVPEIYAHCRTSMQNAHQDLNFIRLDADSFAQCPDISIDYAVMEKTKAAAVVSLTSPWSDVGSWDGLWEIADKDDADNAISGDVMSEGVSGSYLYSENKLLVVKGVKDLAVVDTKDALLVTPREQAQDIKGIVETLQQSKRPEADLHAKVFRPWGSYEGLVETSRFQVKHLVINPGAKISLQRHQYRSEHWVVVSGIARVTLDDKTFDLEKDQSTFIPVNTKHQLENAGAASLEIIEVQTGSYFGEDDIERFEDIYGRV